MSYKLVEPKEGTPIQYLGVYILNWREEMGKPEVGFVEEDEETMPIENVDEELLKLGRDPRMTHKYYELLAKVIVLKRRISDTRDLAGTGLEPDIYPWEGMWLQHKLNVIAVELTFILKELDDETRK